MEPKRLSAESLGNLNYLREVLAQPAGSWEGFYKPMSPSMNFALRYQLAFGSYAVAALAQHTPAYKAPYAEALRGAVEKMLDVASWGYWRAPEQDQVASQGHVAVLLSPHRTAPAGPPSDPVARDNLQYSGHLSTMLGLYEKVSGDGRYDEPFELRDPESGVAYSYTHGKVAGRIHSQMVQNSFGGVCCESGMAYVPCNNHAMTSNALHDSLHGTDYSSANGRWLDWVRKRMVLRGPSARGVFGAAYAKDFHLAAPLAFNFTDAWGLALMMPFDAPLVRKLYRRLTKKITRAGSDGAYLDSTQLSEKMEISDVPINTGFALIAATGMGDAAMAEALRRYAYGTFEAGWEGSKFQLKAAPRTVHATALYALASALGPGAAEMNEMFNGPSNPAGREAPHLAAITPDNGSVGVSRAEFEPETNTLHLELTQVAEPDTRRDAQPVTVRMKIANLAGVPDVKFNGETVESPALDNQGSIELEVPVEPGRITTCQVRS